MIRLDYPEFRYDPYPVAYCRNVFSPQVYEELVANWPDTSLFEFKPALGRKYSLSLVNAPERYGKFVSATPCWFALFAWVQSEEFVRYVIGMLEAHGIELDLRAARVRKTKIPTPLRSRIEAVILRLKHKLNLRLGRRTLRGRFEFSMLPAASGNILPHTDSPGKLVTLVFSMCAAGEWNAAWGGGTEILRARDRARDYNWMNRQMQFDECEVLNVYPFEPNQCVLFVKTHNSLHAVRPMTGPEGTMRRTLTINIEEVT